MLGMLLKVSLNENFSTDDGLFFTARAVPRDRLSCPPPPMDNSSSDEEPLGSLCADGAKPSPNPRPKKAPKARDADKRGTGAYKAGRAEPTDYKFPDQPDAVLDDAEALETYMSALSMNECGFGERLRPKPKLTWNAGQTVARGRFECPWNHCHASHWR